MKILKKSLLILLCLLLSVCFISCKSNSNVFLDENFYTKDGELTISPYFAFYNDGKAVKELENIDPEIYKQGPLDDGAFNIYFAVCNNTEFDRKINEIRVGFIQNDDGYDIVDPSEFTLDSETYIAAGETRIIPCVFDMEFVKLEAKLDNIIAQASVVYEGCVLSAKTGPYTPDGVNSYVDEFLFTSTNGVEGKFTIFNATGADKYYDTIEFNLFTDKNVKINKIPIVMNIDATIKGDEGLTLNYAIMPDNVNDDIKKTKLFNTINIEILGD